MSKLNIQDCTSPKQHYQNYKALVVVDCNDAVIQKEREQEYHIRIRLTYHEISSKIAGFINSKLKAKDIWKLCPDILRSTIYNHYNRIQEKKIIVGRFLELKMVPTHKLLRMQSNKF